MLLLCGVPRPEPSFEGVFPRPRQGWQVTEARLHQGSGDDRRINRSCVITDTPWAAISQASINHPLASSSFGRKAEMSFINDRNTAVNPMKQTTQSSTGSPCACCQKATTNKCGGCLGAPAYGQSPAKRTFYCSTQCQKTDWSRHKAECKALQARKSLRRAAVVLQATLYRIRSNAYPLSVTSVRIDGTRIILDGPKTDETLPQPLESFPSILDDGGEIWEAALMHLGSADAMIYLYNLAKEFLRGKPISCDWIFFNS